MTMPIAGTIIHKLQKIRPIHLFLISVAASEIFTALTVSAMSLLLNGSITGDFLITGAVTALAVSCIIVIILVALIENQRKMAAARREAEEELRRHQEQLEEKVATRTADIEKTVTLLRSEAKERERAEIKLLESENRFRRFLKSPENKCWVCDKFVGKPIKHTPCAPRNLPSDCS